MRVVWKPTPSQVISRLIIGLIRVKSLIFVAGKAAVGNLPDLTNSPGITENIRETGLFNVACANELFPGRIIWHYIWKDTLFPDEVIFSSFQISFLSDSYQVIMYCQVKFWKVNKCTKFSISWFYFWPQVLSCRAVLKTSFVGFQTICTRLLIHSSASWLTNCSIILGILGLGGPAVNIIEINY